MNKSNILSGRPQACLCLPPGKPAGLQTGLISLLPPLGLQKRSKKPSENGLCQPAHSLPFACQESAFDKALFLESRKGSFHLLTNLYRCALPLAQPDPKGN